MSLYGSAFLRRSKRSPEGLGAAAVALPKMIGMDYRTSAASYDATARTLHANYPISVFGMLSTSVDSAADAGYIHIQNLKADRTDKQVFQYIILAQANSELTHAPTYSPVYGPLNTNNWWARDTATSNRTRTGQVSAFNALEVNLCPAYTTADAGTGLKAAASIVEGYKTLILDYMVAIAGAPIDGVFIDNFWGNAGGYTNAATKQVNGSNVAVDMTPTTAIGNYSGAGNNTRTNSWGNRNSIPNPEFRSGLALGVAQCRTNRGAQTGYGSFKVMVNGDGDFTDDSTWGNAAVMNTELTGLVDYNFIEGLTSTVGNGSSNGMGNDESCASAYRGLFRNVLNRVYTAHDNVRVGAVVAAYVGSTSDEAGRTAQKARFALGCALLADCYCSVSDRLNLSGASDMRPWLFDDMLTPVGVPVDARPTADEVGSTGYDGMYKREYSSALVVVNPSTNKGRWMNNAAGTLTIDRTSNVVTFLWSSMPDAMWNAITAGVTKIRLQDLWLTAHLTLNGVFTVATKTTPAGGRTLTWAQTGANIASFSKPRGYIGVQTSVNLTGGGWKRITGTDSGSVALYNGTAGVNVNSTKSQNDGTLVTTLTLWPNDAIILIKQ